MSAALLDACGGCLHDHSRFGRQYSCWAIGAEMRPRLIPPSPSSWRTPRKPRRDWPVARAADRPDPRRLLRASRRLVVPTAAVSRASSTPTRASPETCRRAGSEGAPRRAPRRPNPYGRAVAVLRRVGEGRDPVAGAHADGLREDAVRQLERLQIGGRPAALVTADTRGARATLTWIAHDGHVYRIAGVARLRDLGALRPAFVQSAGSFRPIDDADRRRLERQGAGAQARGGART